MVQHVVTVAAPGGSLQNRRNVQIRNAELFEIGNDACGVGKAEPRVELQPIRRARNTKIHEAAVSAVPPTANTTALASGSSNRLLPSVNGLLANRGRRSAVDLPRICSNVRAAPGLNSSK